MELFRTFQTTGILSTNEIMNANISAWYSQLDKTDGLSLTTRNKAYIVQNEKLYQVHAKSITLQYRESIDEYLPFFERFITT